MLKNDMYITVIGQVVLELLMQVSIWPVTIPRVPRGFAQKCVPSPRAFAQQKMPVVGPINDDVPRAGQFVSTRFQIWKIVNTVIWA